MSFDGNEYSLHKSQPVEYYRFEIDGVFSYYNPTKKDIDINGTVYKSALLQRSSSRRNKDSVIDSSMTITTARNFPIASLFKVIVPERTIWLTIMRLHRGDNPLTEMKTVWVGRVRGCEWNGASAELRAEPIGSMVKRAGLRLNYQRSCNHYLYSSSCGVSKTNFKVVAAIDTLVGNDVYSTVFAQYPDQWFRLGFIELNNYFYMVVDHVGNKITLFAPIEGIQQGATCIAYAGCDRSLDTCKNKFNNNFNYGGFPWHPEENIFLTGVGF